VGPVPVQLLVVADAPVGRARSVAVAAARTTSAVETIVAGLARLAREPRVVPNQWVLRALARTITKAVVHSDAPAAAVIGNLALARGTASPCAVEITVALRAIGPSPEAIGMIGEANACSRHETPPVGAHSRGRACHGAVDVAVRRSAHALPRLLSGCRRHESAHTVAVAIVGTASSGAVVLARALDGPSHNNCERLPRCRHFRNEC
jgi:hypothetical protein